MSRRLKYDDYSRGAKAIETHYRGAHFDSLLEARWAVFFDTVGIPWKREPEYLTSEGIYYPDFELTLSTCTVLCEVKPTAAYPLGPDSRWVQMARTTDMIVGYGLPRVCEYDHHGDRWSWATTTLVDDLDRPLFAVQTDGSLSDNVFFRQCTSCGKISLAGRDWHECCEHATFDDDRIVFSYIKAGERRFGHSSGKSAP